MNSELIIFIANRVQRSIYLQILLTAARSISDNETKMEKIKNFSAKKGKLEYFKGKVYEGEIQNKKPHGVGKMTYKDGRVREGIWEDGKILYEGQLNKRGQPHGTGTWFYPHGTYEGGWQNGQKHGNGNAEWGYGSTSYKGGWKFNLPDGFGIYKYQNGDVYNGGFRAGKRHGNGLMTYANGDTYDGQWENGKKDGQGKLKYNNGDMYEGNFNNDKIHGNGTFVNAAGDTIQGEWKKGKKCGVFQKTFKVEVSEQVYYDQMKTPILPTLRLTSARMFAFLLLRTRDCADVVVKG